ncbi:MAG: hypothetical protein ACLPTZ_23025 [Beijerinckiaceae bacterium]
MSQYGMFSKAAALEAIRAQARRSAVHMVKCRARDFARRPFDLENLYPGLAAARPKLLIAIAEHLLVTAAQDPQRWFGFGGEVKALNAKSALLLGRLLRRREAGRAGPPGALLDRMRSSSREDCGPNQSPAAGADRSEK